MTILCAIGSWWGIRAMELAAKDIQAEWEPVYSPARLPIEVHTHNPDWLFLLNWSEKVPDSVWMSTPTVNFHATDLPFGRGGHPLENLILRGHTDTVITAHQVVAEMDAGAVYGKSEPISLSGSKDDIRGRFIQPVASLMGQIIRGELQPTPQVGEPVLFKRLSEAEYQAVWASRG